MAMRIQLGGRPVRLLPLGFGLLWTAVAVLGLILWQKAADAAVQRGVAPRLLDVLPMVLIPGTLAAFSLVGVLRREPSETDDGVAGPGS